LQHGVDETLRQRRQVKDAHSKPNSREKQRPPNQGDKKAQHLDVQDLGSNPRESPHTRGKNNLQAPTDQQSQEDQNRDNGQLRRVGIDPRYGHGFPLAVEVAEDTEKTPRVCGVFSFQWFSVQ
jgi:hypothetical protein